MSKYNKLILYSNIKIVTQYFMCEREALLYQKSLVW
jgi:hypothetical protein